MQTGEEITPENVRSIRPGYGLHPKYYHGILGKRVNRPLEKGDRFDINFI
jgi:pseudaminic acid synthase